METIKDNRDRQGRSVVAGYEILYSIQNKTQETPKAVVASIMKDEERTGTVNAYSDGKLYITLEAGITDAKQVLNTVMDDIIEVFNETV